LQMHSYKRREGMTLILILYSNTFDVKRKSQLMSMEMDKLQGTLLTTLCV
jgi:hypothetical protein